MQITVKLFATLRNNRFKIEVHEYPEGSTILQVAEALEIPKEELALTLINGISLEVDNALKDGDTLAIFPPVGGG
ncbi:MAG: MoaD/ThiS family protein [Dethiobacter sp.]|jgi:molybdopterin converting factor small subunit|nr:MoaD/ThiS family protein [Dethiobacter sp.]MBS3988567.1 MoaD/ThiS family protein [Dethiobacter sp.]